MYQVCDDFFYSNSRDVNDCPVTIKYGIRNKEHGTHTHTPIITTIYIKFTAQPLLPFLPGLNTTARTGNTIIPFNNHGNNDQRICVQQETFTFRSSPQKMKGTTGTASNPSFASYCNKLTVFFANCSVWRISNY